MTVKVKGIFPETAGYFGIIVFLTDADESVIFIIQLVERIHDETDVLIPARIAIVEVRCQKQHVIKRQWWPYGIVEVAEETFPSSVIRGRKNRTVDAYGRTAQTTFPRAGTG
ncbi:hypothetical protein [uncultured Desulfovibrio sp.]|uniref:hypothetical protein n=1 Tax=uncultured Desulfovibrio sp. TaxID=167968 RepID=UPI002619E2E4|nr:hypothetical protein [uncultured Desulfovibrio sp.]